MAGKNVVIINTKIGQTTKNPTPRIWVEGNHLSRAGLSPDTELGVKFYSDRVEVGCGIENPDRTVNVNRRTGNGTVKPLIELRDDKLGDIFGMGARVRLVVKGGKFVVRLSKVDANVRERLSRAQSKISAGEPLTIGSLFHGGGNLDRAWHQGLKRSGIDSYVKVVNEVDHSFLSVSTSANDCLWRDDTIFIESPIELIDLSSAINVDIVLAGIPCTGASLSGRSKNKLKHAEEHNTAGACFYSYLNFVQATNPVVTVVENVEQYVGTASYAVIESVLITLGYDVRLEVIGGNAFGALENRQRMFMVATTKGMGEFKFESMIQNKALESCAGELLDDVPLDDKRWRTFDYLVEAEAKAKAKGNGFKRSFITADTKVVPTIKRTNHKCQADGVFIQHPENPALSRLPTPAEQARFMSVPEEFVSGLSVKMACELIGQGVAFSVVDSLAQAVGSHMKDFALYYGEGLPLAA